MKKINPALAGFRNTHAVTSHDATLQHTTSRYVELHYITARYMHTWVHRDMAAYMLALLAYLCERSVPLQQTLERSSSASTGDAEKWGTQQLAVTTSVDSELPTQAI